MLWYWCKTATHHLSFPLFTSLAVWDGPDCGLNKGKEKTICPDCVIITFFILPWPCITAGLDLTLHCVYDILWSHLWPLDVLHCHGDSEWTSLTTFPRISEDKWLLCSQISSCRLTRPSGHLGIESENDLRSLPQRGKAHMVWFSGWTLRMANKNHPQVTDLNIITTPDEKCS